MTVVQHSRSFPENQHFLNSQSGVKLVNLHIFTTLPAQGDQGCWLMFLVSFFLRGEKRYPGDSIMLL